MKSIIALLTTLSLFALDVKYQGQVDTSNFKTLPIGKSSFIKDVRYDGNRLLVKIGKVYYMYCNVSSSRADEWGRKDINASMVYLRYFKGQKEIFCLPAHD